MKATHVDKKIIEDVTRIYRLCNIFGPEMQKRPWGSQAAVIQELFNQGKEKTVLIPALSSIDLSDLPAASAKFSPEYLAGIQAILKKRAGARAAGKTIPTLQINWALEALSRIQEALDFVCNRERREHNEKERTYLISYATLEAAGSATKIEELIAAALNRKVSVEIGRPGKTLAKNSWSQRTDYLGGRVTLFYQKMPPVLVRVTDDPIELPEDIAILFERG